MHDGSDDPPSARPSGASASGGPRDAGTSQRNRVAALTAAAEARARQQQDLAAPDVAQPEPPRPSQPSGRVPLPRAPAPEEEHQDVTEVAPSSSISPMIGPTPSGGAASRSPSVAERIKKRGEKDPRVGQVLLGRYRLEKPIAKGGMGRVYLATQLQLGRSVAVKVLNAEFKDTDPQFVRRFGIEASICARLSHPNVVTVHDYGESESGELFMAMELLRGKTLSQIIQKEAPFSPGRTIHIALQTARALREAHAIGIIHRDLKPGNIMLIEAGDDPDFVKVLDFGLVKLFVPEGQVVGLAADEEGDLTRAGTLLGSPRYMSPEQIRGETLDPRTDIYSFGIILFQMAAGRPPFTGNGSVDLIYKHIHEKPPRVSEVAHTECPPELEDLIQRCLEKDRTKRFASMTELIGALKNARSSITGIIERPPTDTGPVKREGASSAIVSGLPMLRADEPTKSGMLAVVPALSTPGGREPAEAAFAEVPGAVLPLPLDPSRSVAMPRPARWPIVTGLLGVFVSAVTLAIVLMRRPATEPAAPTSSPPATAAGRAPLAPGEVELEFRSEPTGATVRSGGVVLGTTPFAARFPASPDGEPRVFVAELEGFVATTTEQRLDTSRFVMLVLNPAPAEAAPPVEAADPVPTPLGSPPAQLEADVPEGELAPGDEEPTATPAAKKRATTPRRAAATKRRPAKGDEDPEAEDDPPPDEGDKKKPARYRTNPY